MMLTTAVHATIRRRVLVNATVEPHRVRHVIPAGLRPQLKDGRAIVGVCLIRLEHLRPTALRRGPGLATENMAHRIAVEWDDDGATRCGVYIPVRHTGSAITAIGGGRLFAADHERAQFTVRDRDDEVIIHARGRSHETLARVAARPTDDVPRASVFRSLDDAADFFARGSVGFSPARRGGLDAVELCAPDPLRLQPLQLDDAQSPVLDRILGASGDLVWDSAFVVRDLRCTWRSPSWRADFARPAAVRSVALEH